MARIAGRSRRARAHYHHLAEALKELDFHLHWDMAASGQLPEAWHEIARQRVPSTKVRLSLWVEGEVVKFFRAMGPGHTVRMADVLRTFMHARLAEVLGGAEAVAYPPVQAAERRERIALLQEMARLMEEEREEREGG
ncbi:BrnA antitoxin family protein [Frigidibacter sp. RF13]|uniref:BrnA antitoxin family protein n=1 Tax=Frigidibacter sp. RF13 TaxID=2997340 RepID=UPI00227087F2|nr:BrnA antitoxin family protein [Frigidibacter sp. RF13]MCY1126294.1 BrnA antitoxin family protein [Frigidibacter sp. RF13]